MIEIINLGDITKIKGNEAPLVDIITGGSPCQDLSVAGRRAGLEGERSGLFMEQIRIIKEQRNESIKKLSSGGAAFDIRCVQPRYMVWENVPGAFSSNNGEDFRCVLEEICKVADENAYVPGLEKGQRWAYAGCIMGDGYSVAWRLHDAQFWGVPQRRKRICVLADYGGATAPKILFELIGETEYTEANKVVTDIGAESESEIQSFSESMSRDFEQGKETGQRTAGTSGNSIGEASSYILKIRGGVEVDSRGKKAGKGALVQKELSGTLGVSQDQTLITHSEPTIIQRRFSTANTFNDGISPCLEAGAGEGGNNMPMVFEPGAMSRVGGHIYEDSTGSLRANAGDNQQAVCYGISPYDSNAVKSSNPHSGIYEADTSRTLDLNGGSPACNQDGMAVVTYGLDRASFNQGKNAQFGFSVDEELAPSLVAKGPGGVLAKR